ncbi:ALF repeat-containing protein [Streptomyces sp. NPDC051211]|uniref:ALF repeat-containing protein n=1 Tax=Streptomyces sp. NPDC051211 TaxID=3154643 RepID=UPI00344EDBF6
MKTAATAALGQSPQQMQEFLHTGRYAAARTDNRVKILSLVSAGGASVKETGQKALETDTPDALNAFLKRGQHEARATDERVVTMSLLSSPASGEEVKAAARIALAGPPALVHDFVQYGRHSAQVKDDQTAAHRQQIQGLIAEASSVAADAQKNAWKAAQSAATANNEAGAAQEAAANAQKSADAAAGYAQDAKNSAAAAQASANKATASATAARSAAAVADSDAFDAAASARRAESSYAWARSSAFVAYQAADDAYKSSVAAGQDAEAADKAKWHAFGSFVEKYRKEGLQRQAEEEERIRQDKEKKSNPRLVCVPSSTSRLPGPSCIEVSDNGVTPMYPYFVPIFTAAVGIDDLKDCAAKKTPEACAWAAAAIVPLPGAKLGVVAGKFAAKGDDIGKVFTGVESLALAARGARPQAVWINPRNGDDALLKIRRRHREGGDLQKNDPDAGVFEGKYVKGDAGVSAAINKTIAEGTVSKNTGDRPGIVYELDHHKPLGRMGKKEGRRPATAIRVVLDPETNYVITAHPI